MYMCTWAGAHNTLLNAPVWLSPHLSISFFLGWWNPDQSLGPQETVPDCWQPTYTQKWAGLYKNDRTRVNCWVTIEGLPLTEFLLAISETRSFPSQRTVLLYFGILPILSWCRGARKRYTSESHEMRLPLVFEIAHTSRWGLIENAPVRISWFF